MFFCHTAHPIAHKESCSRFSEIHKKKKHFVIFIRSAVHLCIMVVPCLTCTALDKHEYTLNQATGFYEYHITCSRGISTPDPMPKEGFTLRTVRKQTCSPAEGAPEQLCHRGTPRLMRKKHQALLQYHAGSFFVFCREYSSRKIMRDRVIPELS